MLMASCSRQLCTSLCRRCLLLSSMGGDGGSIAQRTELVKTKKKPQQKDKHAENLAKWRLCALSQQPLQRPVVACQLGRLYNKEAVIRYLLDSSEFGEAASAPQFAHLKSLRDVHEVQLTDNPDFQADVNHNHVAGQNGPDSSRLYPFVCPITNLPMNGNFSFSFFLPCCCVLSDRAFKTLLQQDSSASTNGVNYVCPFCQGTVLKEDRIQLNPPTDEAVEALRQRMNARRLERKSKKRKQRKPAEEQHQETTDPKRLKESKDSEPSTSAASTALSKPSKLTNVRSIDVKNICSGVPRSIQKDPNSTEVFKTLFNTHQSAENGTSAKAHWAAWARKSL